MVFGFLFFLLILSIHARINKVKEYDVVVIGSGISGISAASFLSQRGKSVAVLEQCPNIGGSLQTFSRVGDSGLVYSFVPGMHLLSTDGSMFEKISGKNITMTSFGDFTDLLFFDTKTKSPYIVPKGFDNYMKYLEESFPEEINAIKIYSDTIKTIQNDSLTMDELLGKISKNVELDILLGYMEGYTSIDPFPVSWYSKLIHVFDNGGAFPAGSSKRIVDGAVDIIRNAGGSIYPGCAATKLNLNLFEEVKSVESECGTFKTKNVISSMGAKNTFNEDFVSKKVLQKHGYLSEVSKLSDSFTAMQHFIGFNVSNDVLKFPIENIWYIPLSLDDDDDDDIFKVTEAFTTCISARDPLSPQDRTTLIIMYDTEFDWFEKWENSFTHNRPKDYYEFKKKFEDAALKWLYELFPESKDYLDLVVSATPLTIRDYLRHHSGSEYGATVRLENTKTWLKSKTKISGLYIAGQDLVGAGVQRNLENGIEAAKLLLE